jgi:hypothetical protein
MLKEGAQSWIRSTVDDAKYLYWSGNARSHAPRSLQQSCYLLGAYCVGSGVKACGCLYPPGRVGSYVGVADSNRGDTKLKSLAQIQVVVVVCTGKASRSARLTMVTCRAGCAFLFGGPFLSQTRLDRLAWTLDSTLYGMSLFPRCRLQHGTWPSFPSCDQAITACTIYRLSADADAGARGEQVLSHRGSEVTAVTYASHETSANGQKATK